MSSPLVYDAETKILSNPSKDVSPKMCLGERILKKLTENDPNKVIEVNYDNGEELTSSQLKTLTINIAKNLLDLGIKKGDVVLFYSSMNSLTTPIVYACYAIGAAICPLELTFQDDDADFIIKLLNPTVILYDPIFKSRVDATLKRINLPNLKHVLSFASSDDGKSVPEMLCKPGSSIDAFVLPELGDPDKVVACLMLSSGTTGRPKVISLSHSQMSFGVLSLRTVSSNSIVYVPSPFRWITPVVLMLSPIFYGCSRVFSGQIPSIELCCDLIKQHKISNFFAVEGFIVKMLQYVEKQKYGDYLKTLKYVITGGENSSKITKALAKIITPDCIYAKGYGMTELASCVASTAYESIPSDSECGCGYISEGLSIKIIDDNMESLGPNQNGQICIKCITPNLKYYLNDKANDETFTEDDWYLTGDYGKFDNANYLHVFGRCKDLIKCGEYVIIPSVIEKHLEGHRDVIVSYIVGIPDSNKGEIPVAFIKLRDNVPNDPKSIENLKADINEYLKSKLSSDELPPEKIYFLENVPFTTCGKASKLKMKEIARESSRG